MLWYTFDKNRLSSLCIDAKLNIRFAFVEYVVTFLANEGEFACSIVYSWKCSRPTCTTTWWYHHSLLWQVCPGFPNWISSSIFCRYFIIIAKFFISPSSTLLRLQMHLKSFISYFSNNFTRFSKAKNKLLFAQGSFNLFPNYFKSFPFEKFS